MRAGSVLQYTGLYCREEGLIVLQDCIARGLAGDNLYRNTMDCIVTETRHGLYCNTVTIATTRCAGARLGAQALGWARGRWAGRAGAQAGAGRGRSAQQALGRAAGVGARSGSNGCSGRTRQAQAWEHGALGVGRAGSAAWACWLVSWAKLVHCAPGSVLTQFLTGLTWYYS